MPCNDSFFLAIRFPLIAITAVLLLTSIYYLMLRKKWISPFALSITNMIRIKEISILFQMIALFGQVSWVWLL